MHGSNPEDDQPSKSAPVEGGLPYRKQLAGCIDIGSRWKTPVAEVQEVTLRNFGVVPIH